MVGKIKSDIHHSSLNKEGASQSTRLPHRGVLGWSDVHNLIPAYSEVVFGTRSCGLRVIVE